MAVGAQVPSGPLAVATPRGGVEFLVVDPDRISVSDALQAALDSNPRGPTDLVGDCAWAVVNASYCSVPARARLWLSGWLSFGVTSALRNSQVFPRGAVIGWVVAAFRAIIVVVVVHAVVSFFVPLGCWLYLRVAFAGALTRCRGCTRAGCASGRGPLTSCAIWTPTATRCVRIPGTRVGARALVVVVVPLGS